MLFPVLLFGQDIAMAINDSGEKFDINDFIHINQGNYRFSDTATESEMSASPIMMGCMGLLVDFHSSTGINGPQSCNGVINGLNIDSYSEGLSSSPSVGPGSPIATSPPSVQQVTITRVSDEYSAQLKSLLITGEIIPYIQISQYSDVSAYPNPFFNHRYEDCIITDLQSSTSAGSPSNEQITFAFTKACYQSNELNMSGGIISQTSACVDQTLTNQTTCSCN
jgi:type VI protein secretion system component Hcp